MSKRKSTRRRARAKSNTVKQTTESKKQDYSTLPETILLSLLLKLNVKEIGLCCCVCKAFARIGTDQKFWEVYCTTHWGEKTDPASWLVPRSTQTSRIPNLPRPASFLELGLLLSQLEGLVGLWQGSLDADLDQKGFFSFQWGKDCLHCTQGLFDFCICLSIGPQHYITAEVIDGCHCILKDYSEFQTQLKCSSEALAAASVAVGPLAGLYMTQNVLNNFPTEMTEFFQSKVYSKKKTKCRYRGALCLVPLIFHFTRVKVPTRTKRKWLAGLWTNTPASKTDPVEVLLIDHDFSQKHPQIKVEFIGGAQLSSGEILWWFISRYKAKRELGYLATNKEVVLAGSGSLSQGMELDEKVMVSGSLEIISENCICFKSEEIDLFRNGKSVYSRIISSEGWLD